MKNEKILEIRDLSISFKTSSGSVNAIRGVKLDLYRGETLAIVGESGSGKSVTMKAAMGILSSNGEINSGRINFTYYRGEEKGKTGGKRDRAAPLPPEKSAPHGLPKPHAVPKPQHARASP